jgi:hypothetical protein
VTGIHTEHADLAIVACPVSLENLDRRCLDRPVRAEQREDLTAADREVDPADCLHAGV